MEAKPEPTTETKAVATTEQTPVVAKSERAATVAATRAAGTQSYEDALGCVKCYAKHVSKALVQWHEWREDNSRTAELALCIGNIGCAEDHAAALDRHADAEKLRDIRAHIWDADVVVAGELQTLAAGAIRAALQAVAAEKREVAEAAKRARDAASGTV